MYAYQFSFAQCTPNSAITDPGLSPADSLLPCIVSGEAYDTVIQFKNFTTVDPNDFGIPTPIPITITVNYVRIDTILNVPPGISYSCNTADCFYNSGESGCLRVSGTTSASRGNYPLDLVVTLSLSIPFFGDTVITISSSEAAQNGFGGLFSYTLQVINPGDPCPYPTVNISSPNAVTCANQPIQLNAVTRFGQQPFTYSWSPANGLDDATIANPVATISADATYIVTVTDANNITFSNTINIIAEEAPTADFSFTVSGNTVSFVNTSTGALGGAQWNFGDGQTGTGNTISNTYDSQQGLSFDVTMTAQNDCGTNSITKTVVITGIAEKRMNDFFISVVPNPNQGIFSLEMDIEKIKGESATIKILDVQGKEVYSISKQINASSLKENINASLQKGIYFIHVFSEKLKSTQKIIVH